MFLTHSCARPAVLRQSPELVRGPHCMHVDRIPSSWSRSEAGEQRPYGICCRPTDLMGAGATVADVLARSCPDSSEDPFGTVRSARVCFDGLFRLTSPQLMLPWQSHSTRAYIRYRVISPQAEVLGGLDALRRQPLGHIPHPDPPEQLPSLAELGRASGRTRRRWQEASRAGWRP